MTNNLKYANVPNGSDTPVRLGTENIKAAYETTWSDGTQVIIHPDGTIIRSNTGEFIKFGTDSLLISRLASVLIARNTATANQLHDNSIILNSTNKTKISSSDIPIKAVVLYAAADNSGTISVGGSSITSTNASIVLEAGDRLELQINDIRKVHAIASSADDVLNFILIQ